MAYLVHREERPAVVISHSSRGGELVSEPRKVTEIFREFFPSLYTSMVSEDNSTIDYFLNEVQIPQLTSQQTAELEKPLLAEEIAEAIAKFSRSKSPGSFSGLKINWDKFQILPLGSFPTPQAQAHFLYKG